MQIIPVISTQDIHWANIVNLYIHSFPEQERREVKVFDQLFIQKSFCVVKAMEDTQFIAFMMYWEFENTIFLEHFAVEKNMRGKQYGQKMMHWLLHHTAEYFVLEVEHPFDIASQKRIHFYEKLGFTASGFDYFQPPYRPSHDKLPLLLMSKPAITNQVIFRKIISRIHEVVYDHLPAS